MSRPPRQPGASAWGATLGALAVAELDRFRRLRWVALGAVVIVVAVLVWALVGAPGLGVSPLVVLAVVLAVVTVLFGIEVVAAGKRASRLVRAASSEEQQRRGLTADVEQLEAVDVAARRLAGVTTLSEAVECTLSGARGLVPAVSGAVLLAAADDLRLSMHGSHVTDEAAAVSAAGEGLAARALARGVALRSGHDTALEQEGAPSRLAVPLRASAEVVGVLVLERATDNDAFSPAEQRLLERLAPHAALALVRAGHLDDRPATTGASQLPAAPAADVALTPALSPDAAGASARDAAGETAPVAPAGAAPPADVSEVVREVVADLGAGERSGRRIAVLASTPAPSHVDRAQLRRALEAVLQSLDRSLPPDGAVAIEVLPVGPDWEVAVAHAGEVLPRQVLEGPPPGAPGGRSLRELADELGGVVSARERSGMAQIRFRVPGVGDRVAAAASDRWQPSAVT